MDIRSVECFIITELLFTNINQKDLILAAQFSEMCQFYYEFFSTRESFCVLVLYMCQFLCPSFVHM